MNWQQWIVSNEGTPTPLSLIVIGGLLFVLILHEFTRPQPPRVMSRSGCILTLVTVPLLAVFLSVVVIRFVQILFS